LGDGRLDRRGDESGDGIRIRSRINRGDGDDAVFGFRILQHLQRTIGAQPDDQDDQAYHARENGTTDEDVGEIQELSRAHSFGGVGLMSLAGGTLLLTTTGEPLRSFIWPD